MSKLRFSITMSLDGYVAGPNQSLENPLGVGGMRLHEWAFQLTAWRESHGDKGGGEVNPSSAIIDEMFQNVGAVIMGRHMFGGGTGAWDNEWKGWWGDDPPYHMPVFVLTHHARESLPMKGGTTFHFVTDGFDAALAQAKAAAGDGDVQITGGASTINQALAAGVVDELRLHHRPVFLGSGEPLRGVDRLSVGRVIPAPSGAHVTYTS
jgi:dihydrofolate reductase